MQSLTCAGSSQYYSNSNFSSLGIYATEELSSEQFCSQIFYSESSYIGSDSDSSICQEQIDSPVQKHNFFKSNELPKPEAFPSPPMCSAPFYNINATAMLSAGNRQTIPADSSVWPVPSASCLNQSQVARANLSHGCQPTNCNSYRDCWPSTVEPQQTREVDDNLCISDLEVSDEESDGEEDSRKGFHFYGSHSKVGIPNITSILPHSHQAYQPDQAKRISNYHPLGKQCAEKQKLRQKSGKQPILSHVLLYVLAHPKEYESMIKWVDRTQGIFEFSSKNKENLARAWGLLKKNRCNMTYPKMARAMRKYIENGIVLEKIKCRLRYKFLPIFLSDVRCGREFPYLSTLTKQKLYQYSRPNYTR